MGEPRVSVEPRTHARLPEKNMGEGRHDERGGEKGAQMSDNRVKKEFKRGLSLGYAEPPSSRNRNHDVSNRKYE